MKTVSFRVSSLHNKDLKSISKTITTEKELDLKVGLQYKISHNFDFKISSSWPHSWVQGSAVDGSCLAVVITYQGGFALMVPFAQTWEIFPGKQISNTLIEKQTDFDDKLRD
ncbi:uncharacterized protein LOC113292900 [Papaver somniferum]|uniref:uncharacterized protein LOC113292900 n=1 Tax=Papaver somniferum TaxID=3469 RepID=UPI000E7057BD|nr:uncharacterized protein LOC113292900 [Papaver somniferum]XP_026397504.1 uncharacterized protein LOC113292900 [Papaver somniferum]